MDKASTLSCLPTCLCCRDGKWCQGYQISMATSPTRCSGFYPWVVLTLLHGSTCSYFASDWDVAEAFAFSQLYNAVSILTYGIVKRAWDNHYPRCILQQCPYDCYLWSWLSRHHYPHYKGLDWHDWLCSVAWCLVACVCFSFIARRCLEMFKEC